MGIWICCIGGILAGLLSGLLGIGGGVLLVPILYYLLKLDIHIAIGTSLAVIVFTATAGAIAHFALANINLKIVWIIAIFAVIGSILGANLCRSLSAATLRRLFAIILFLLSAKMFFVAPD